MSPSPTFAASLLAVDRPTLTATRLALHRLAFYVLSASRQAATGRIGLRATPGGFGTPPFDDADGTRRVLRVEDGDLVVESDGQVERAPITTLAAAAEMVGITPDAGRGAEFDVPDLGSPDESMAIEPEVAALLGAWYRFGFDVLEVVRSEATPDDDATEAQLWPEHFDVGVDMGSAEAGVRASYGASPGDDGHPEPYLYVAAGGDVDGDDPFWNDPHFSGASLGLSELSGAGDPAGRAVSFLVEGRRRLTTRP